MVTQITTPKMITTKVLILKNGDDKIHHSTSPKSSINCHNQLIVIAANNKKGCAMFGCNVASSVEKYQHTLPWMLLPMTGK